MFQYSIEKILNKIYYDCSNINDGHLPTYIPELSKANPNNFGISIVDIKGQCWHIGDTQKDFTIQSVVKPFMYGLALEMLGSKAVLDKIGLQPTHESYDSMVLQAESFKPFNPMMNAGALVLAEIIPGHHYNERTGYIKNILDRFAGRPLYIDQAVYHSEKMLGHHNRTIANRLIEHGILTQDPTDTLECYFQACSFNLNTNDMALMAATLANKGFNPITQQLCLQPKFVQKILSILYLCGLYNFSGAWAYTVGIPAKSGVSGGILGIVPGRMGVAVYSPLLDPCGNSVRAIKVFQKLAKALNFTLF